jgi:ABC-type uncharacterized transport system ATPase subunit
MRGSGAEAVGEAAPAPSARVVMRGITKRFPGVLANDRVDFRADAREIHGLLGENGAGKTTLMRILFGLVQPDEGTIEIDGQVVGIPNPRAALAHGVGMVHQHFMLVPGMTVAENLALGLRGDRSLLDPVRNVARKSAELAAEFGFAVRPDDVVDHLTVGQRQQVEILKLLYRGARILILDEPTAALTPQEWERLAVVLRGLAEAGAAVILITHKLDELFDVAEKCTVLRDGRVVGTRPVAGADKAGLARMMVGRPVTLRVERRRLEPGRVRLDVRGLSLDDDSGGRRLADIDLTVREREVVGVAGVEGNGQHELIDVLTGMRRPTAGEILLNGQRLVEMSPRAFIDAGGAVIPADRHGTGLALDLTLAENLVMKEVRSAPLSERGLVNPGAVRRLSWELLAAYDIRAPGPEILARQLSGGNQQKAILARELRRRPSVLVAAHPSRGLDVGALEFVYGQIVSHCKAGAAVLLVSNELDEILSLSDRVAVMVGGRLVRVLDAATLDLETLGLLMAGETLAT